MSPCRTRLCALGLAETAIASAHYILETDDTQAAPCKAAGVNSRAYLSRDWPGCLFWMSLQTSLPMGPGAQQSTIQNAYSH